MVLSFNERIDAIAEAWNHDFRTSVSIEPMLDAGHIEELVSVVQSYVSDSIWIGRMNHVRRRVIIKTPEDEAAVRRIEDGQTDEQIRRIYNALKTNVSNSLEGINQVGGGTAAGYRSRRRRIKEVPNEQRQNTNG